MIKTLKEQIKNINEFIDKHEGEDLQIKLGILSTKGCDNKFGGCCSKSLDLLEIVSDLEEAIDWIDDLNMENNGDE